MAISASQVKELRVKTGAGMMDCKKALTEADGDFEKAVEILRKKGASVAAKRAERSADEGIVLTRILDDGKTAVILEVNCETDFVAKSDDFIGFANTVLDTVAENRPGSVDELLTLKAGDLLISEKLTEIIGKIGEKIQVSRFKIESAPDGLIFDYIHHGSKLGVLVRFDKAEGVEVSSFETIARDIAMQIAAMKPGYVKREEVPAEVIEKEKEIYKELAIKEGKPERSSIKLLKAV